MRRASPFLLLPLLLVVARDARAAEGAVKLTWIAPKECPSGADVSSHAAERMPADAHVKAQGNVTKAQSGSYRLVLEIESKGERTIEAPTCDAIASSAAVILAMSVAPEEKEKEKPVAAVAPAPSVTQRDVVAPAPTPPQKTNLIDLRAHAIGDVGTLPSAGMGGGVAIGVNPSARLHLEIAGNLWASQDGTLASDEARGATFQLITTGARGCYSLLSSSSVAVMPCLGAELNILSAKGFGAAKPSDATSVGWAPELALMMLVPITNHFSIRAGLSASAPTSRQAFVIAQGVGGTSVGSEVHRSSSIVGRGFLGPEVSF